MSSTIGKMTTKHSTEIQVRHHYILDAAVTCFTSQYSLLSQKKFKSFKS